MGQHDFACIEAWAPFVERQPQRPIDARRSKGEPDALSPPEVPVSPAAAAIGLPRPPRPPMKVRRSSESCMRPDHGVIGFPAPTPTPAFLPGQAVSLRPPFTAHLRALLHPPASFPPSRQQRLAHCPSYTGKPHDSPAPKSASHGVPFPHRDISRRRPPLRGIPAHGQVPSSAFLTSPTVSSATGLAGLFHPAATSRICPAGVCPSPRSRTGFRRPRHALLSLNASSCGMTRASLCALAFRALLPAVSAVPSKVC